MEHRVSDRIDPTTYPGLDDAACATLQLDGEAATRQLGAQLGDAAVSGDFIGLVGSLGAGKTTLSQGLVDAVDDSGRWRATSPTYALIQIYETRPPIYHIDLYRLEGWAGLESIGYWDYADSRRGICCVEWLDRIPGAWPGHGLIVQLSRHDDGRRARLWADDDWSQRLEDWPTHIDITADSTG